MEKYEEIEKTITKTYRKEIWKRFIKGITECDMIQEGDKIAVCISGGKDSMLLAKCFQELKKHRKMNFDVEFIVMNPGYNELNKQKIIENSKILNIPIKMFETDIFNRVVHIEDSPCYLCARMRRGYLDENAKSLGCNKIALGHHFNDVIETILLNMLYAGQFGSMLPKIHSDNFENMTLIRPLYLVKEYDIKRWMTFNELEFIDCACSVTKKKNDSKRQEMKELIEKLKEVYDDVDKNIFKASENVNLDTLLGYYDGDNRTSFLDRF